MELSGRGRRPATLEGTGNRDLGFANIGQPPLPENEFVWTLDNTGDLQSGALLVENDNETEFVILDDGRTPGYGKSLGFVTGGALLVLVTGVGVLGSSGAKS